MSQLTALASRPKAPVRLTRNSKILKTILRAIFEKKGEKVVSLDLRKVNEAVSDFFIVCEAPSPAQVKSIGDHIMHLVKEETGEAVYHHEGFQQAKWILVDYVNVVVHVMQPETRKFYNLEEMWSDAPMTEHNDG